MALLKNKKKTRNEVSLSIPAFFYFSTLPLNISTIVKGKAEISRELHDEINISTHISKSETSIAIYSVHITYIYVFVQFYLEYCPSFENVAAVRAIDVSRKSDTNSKQRRCRLF